MVEAAAAVVAGEAVAAVAEVEVVAVSNLVSRRGDDTNSIKAGLAATMRLFATAVGKCVEANHRYRRRRPYTQKQQRPHIHGIGVLI